MGDTALGEDSNVVRKFVGEIKPEVLEKQLHDALGKEIRLLAQKLDHTEIYGIQKEVALLKPIDQGGGKNDDQATMSIQATEVVKPLDSQDQGSAAELTTVNLNVSASVCERLNEQFASQGIQILSVMIKSVNFPPDVQSQMSRKTIIPIQKIQQQMIRQDTMQNITMSEDIKTMLQMFREKQEQERQVGSETINSERVKLNDELVQSRKAAENFQQETKSRLDSMQAENELQIQRVQDRMAIATSKIEADADKLCAGLLATATLETQTRLSDATLEETTNFVAADKMISKAEGRIAKWLDKKNQFLTSMKRLQVYEKLASNEDLVLCFSNDPTVNIITVADAILHKDPDAESSLHSVLAAELTILSNASLAFCDNI